jgi:hypothetical protein
MQVTAIPGMQTLARTSSSTDYSTECSNAAALLKVQRATEKTEHLKGFEGLG